MILYYHPLSSYCWKVLIALYENDTPFERAMMEDPGVADAWLTLWPLGNVVKLDATVDRRVLRQQRDRLGALGYDFAPLTQDWHLRQA